MKKDVKFLGSTGHPVRTIEEVKAATKELVEFKAVEDSLTNFGLNSELAKIKAGRSLDSNTTNPTTFAQKLEHAYALLSTHQRLGELSTDIIYLDPSLKRECRMLTDYSETGTKQYPTFESRIRIAETLLTQARQFKGSGIDINDQYEMTEYLQSSNVQDALTDIIVKYGNDSVKIESSKEWKALTWRIEEKYPRIEAQGLHKALNNEIQRVRKVYEQSFLNASPLESKTTPEQRIAMAEFFKDFTDLKLETKHELKPKELMDKVFEKNPELKNRLTAKQLELIENKLGELGKHYTEINRIKNMTAEQQRGYVKDMIKKEYPNFDFAAGFDFKIYFGGATGSTIYIYFPETTFIQMQYSEAYPGKKWSSLSKAEQQARVDDPRAFDIPMFGALNMLGNVVFVNSYDNPLTIRRKDMEAHEDVHTMTMLSGAKESPKWSYEHYDKLLSQGKYNEYVKLRFQEEFTGISDEIVAKIIDGTSQEGIVHSFERTYWHHYTKNILPRIPTEHRFRIAALHTRAINEFKTIFKRAHYFANKIKTYPNGENILRFTPVQRWEKMYNHLKSKHGYEVLTNNVEQTLPVAKEQAFKCANGELYITTPSREIKIVKDKYGYAIERNGQLVDLEEGQTIEFKRRKGEPATLEIEIKDNRIHITNLSDTPNRVDVYEAQPEAAPQAAAVKGVQSEDAAFEANTYAKRMKIETSKAEFERNVKKAQEALDKYKDDPESVFEKIKTLNHAEVKALIGNKENIKKIKNLLVEVVLPYHSIEEYVLLKSKFSNVIDFKGIAKKHFEKVFNGENVDIMDIAFAKKLFPDIKIPEKLTMTKAELETKITEMIRDWQDPKLFIKQYKVVVGKLGISEVKFKNICFDAISKVILAKPVRRRGSRSTHLTNQDWRHIKSVFKEIGITQSEITTLINKTREAGNNVNADNAELYLLVKPEETALATNPFERKLPSLSKIEVMAAVTKAFDKIPERYKESWSIENLYDQILKSDPTLNEKLSPGQKKLIKQKITEFKKRYELIAKLKNNPEAQMKYMKEIFTLKGLQLPKNPNFKMSFKNSDIVIHFSQELFAQYRGRIENWDTLSAEQKTEYLKRYEGNGGANYAINGQTVSIFNGLKRKKAMVTHEGEHSFAKLLGVHNNKKIYQEVDKLFKEEKYPEALKKIYQADLMTISDEIIAFIREGKVQKYGETGFLEFFVDQYVKRFTKRTNEAFGKIPSLMPSKIRYEDQFKESTKQAVENALRIVRYPNGINILRLTHVSRWGKVLAKLEGKYGVI